MSLELNFTIPGQVPQTVALNQSTMMVGTLLSNHVVLRAPGVDPIHALIEANDDGGWTITDLGSSGGVRVNGKSIEVESSLAAGDRLQIGSVDVAVSTQKAPAFPVEAKEVVSLTVPVASITIFCIHTKAIWV